MKQACIKSWICGVFLFLLFIGTSVGTDVDIKKPALQAIRDRHLKDLEAAETQHRKSLHEILNRQLASARKEVSAKSKAGGDAIAAARAKVTWLQECLACLVPSEPFNPPPVTRPEVDSVSLVVFQERMRIQDEYTNAVARVRVQSLAEVNKATGGLPAGEAEAVLARLLAPPEPTPPMTQPAPTNAPPVAEYFASSGEMDKWMAVGQWSTELKDVDVLSIPVSRFGADVEDACESPTAGTIKWIYKAKMPFTPTDARQYRLRRLPDLEPVDVLEWPTSANEFMLVVRTHPAAAGKVAGHGFEIEVDGAKVKPAPKKSARP